MINWLAFIAVAVATLVGAVAVVGLYSLGVRLYAVSIDDNVPATRAAKIAAFACFTLCSLTVLYGIYLIIPAFHH